jgi:hypothetical protein
MIKLRLLAIAALLVIALSSCSVTISTYPRAAPTIYATIDLTARIDVTWYPVNGAVAYNVFDPSYSLTIPIGQGVLHSSGAYYFFSDYPLTFGWYNYRVESVFADGGYSPLSAQVSGYAY